MQNSLIHTCLFLHSKCAIIYHIYHLLHYHMIIYDNKYHTFIIYHINKVHINSNVKEGFDLFKNILSSKLNICYIVILLI